MRRTKIKILIADPDEQIGKLLKSSKSAGPYVFETAKMGFECLAKLDTFQPDLVLLELMLPQIHGMEILRKIKSDPRTHHIGVILTAAHAMIQNYQAAIKLQCDYFLEKPFDATFPFSLFKLFFNSKLQPAPFAGQQSNATKGKHCYLQKCTLLLPT